MNVKGPTVEGSTFTGQGVPILTYSATMRYLVEGVTGDKRTRFLRAENAPGIPAYWEPFPGLEDLFVIVVRKRPRALDSETYEVLVDYERPDVRPEDNPDELATEPKPEDARLTTSGATVEVETNLDKFGQPIFLEFTPPGALVPVRQAAKVRVRTRVVRMVFSRTERRQPTDLIDNYTNTYNSDAVGKYAPGELFLENIDSTSTDGQRTFQVDYNILQRKGGGWDPSAFFVDARTGRPPEGLIEGVGIKTIPYYESMPFADLKLPWPD